MKPRILSWLAVGFMAVFASHHTTTVAATFVFDTDPFAGSTALTTPGRQIVGGEATINFDIATDVFVFDEAVFGIGDLHFVNDVAANLPTSGVNMIVLQEFGPPMAAGTAANLIAAQLTSPGAGFFIYFNTGLNLPRLVYSTDLDDPTSDLRVLARLENLAGQPGALPTFAEENFAIRQAPEPGTVALLVLGLAALCCVQRRGVARATASSRH